MNPYPLQQFALGIQQKSPKRITITVPFAILNQLIERSGYEGRSISNLAASIFLTPGHHQPLFLPQTLLSQVQCIGIGPEQDCLLRRGALA